MQSPEILFPDPFVLLTGHLYWCEQLKYLASRLRNPIRPFSSRRWSVQVGLMSPVTSSKQCPNGAVGDPDKHRGCPREVRHEHKKNKSKSQTNPSLAPYCTSLTQTIIGSRTSHAEAVI